MVTPDSTTSQLTLSWTAPGNVGVTGYKIEREVGIGNGWSTLVASTGNTNVSYTDTGLVFGTFYNYRVSTVTPVNVSIPGNTYAQTTFHLPDPVIDLVATEGSAVSINLGWSAPSNPYGNIIGYTIYEITNPGVTATATAVLSTTLDQISTITINNGGTLYTTAPTVTISVPGGVAPFVTATATATITNGIVTGITITNNGNGYNEIPTVTLNAPAVNTIVSASTILVPIISDTGTTVTQYTVNNLDPTLDYSFAIAPITIHGSTIIGANISTINVSQLFEGTSISFSQDINPSQIPIQFTENRVGSDTILAIKYGASLDVTCETSSPFSVNTQTYPSLSETPLSGNEVQHLMTFQNSDNSITDIECYDVNDNTPSGTHRINQRVLPIQTQMSDFQDNVFNTGTTFGVLDLMTLFVVIISMIGFNRKNPGVGVGIMVAMLGGLAYFEIISLPTVAYGSIALVVVLAIGQVKNR